MEEVHQRLMVKAEFFYADYGVVPSTDLGWLQTAFNFMTGLFDRVGLRTNVRKNVGMVFWPPQTAGVWADEAYTWRMMGEGRRFKE